MNQKHISFILFFAILALFTFENQCVAQQGNEYLAFADKMPEPVGGLTSIYQTIQYPETAKKAGIQGKVYVLAFINENGGVDDVKLIKGIGAGCDEAAIEAVKKAKFTPGKMGGNSAKVKLSLQIQFKLT